MTTPTTYEQFVAQVTESSLLSAEDIAVVVSAVPKDRRPKDGEQLARELVRQNKLTVYQAQQVYAGKGKELVRGNYVILDKLGKGGMGVVYKAEHKRMRRQVALKVLSPQATKSPEAVKRFHREVEAAAKLNHPHIVAAYDADEFNGTHFLVMEYVEGDDLSNTVKKNGPLSVDKAVSYMLQAARGLEFAHQRGVIHRDIKPANMLLDADGNVKILDMGLARFESDVAGEAELTSTGQVMGTIDYMAPEQALSTKQADQRSDIYSLGMSLWFLLTGHAAYGGDSLMARMLAHREQPIPSLCASRKDAPKQLDAVFAKMIAKNAKDRYQSMSEVVAALETCRLGSAEWTEPQVKKDEDRLLGAVLREQSRPSQMKLPVAQPLTPEKPAKSIVGAKPPAAHAAPPDARPAPRAAAASTAPPPARSKTNVLSVEETMNTGAPTGNTDSQMQRLFNVATPSPLPASITKKRSQPAWQDPRMLLVGGIGLAVVAGVLLLGVAAIAFFNSPDDEQIAQLNPPTSGTTVDVETLSPPGQPVATGGTPVPRSSIKVLSELGVADRLMGPWPSTDGLRLYFEGPHRDAQSASGILLATRPNISAPFGPPVFLLDARHPSLTDDELEMACTGHGVPSPLMLSRRVSRDGTFAPPDVIFPHKLDKVLESNPKSPFLSGDGLVLLFQRENDNRKGIEIAFTRRLSRLGRWAAPEPMLAMNEVARGKPPTWPWANRDDLLLVYCHGGDTAAEIWTATRSSKKEPFGDFRPMLVDGQPLLGRSPRYCEATGELFFSQNVGNQAWQLAVLKDFWPQGKPASAIGPTPAIATPPIGFTALFNGRDFSGWEVMQTSGNSASDQSTHFRGSGGWEINQGVLKCATQVRGWLKTQREFENFVLRLEYRLPQADSNSGVYIRSPDAGHLSSVGMEVQIFDSPAANGEGTGTIARASTASGRAARPMGEWNQLEISCDGQYVQTSLNGESMVATSMATNAALRGRPRRGFIGLANWMGQAQGVEFRNIWIKELPAKTSSTTNTPASTAWIQLFNGRDLAGWQKIDGSPAHWKVVDGCLEAAPGGSIRTVEVFGPDIELQAEFWLPSMPQRTGQARANSGIFLLGRHEVQIVDAFNNNVGGPDRTCGSIYGEVAVIANAIRPPETWQTYHIRYQSPRWTPEGKLGQSGRATVTHNGVEVIANAALTSNGPGGPITAVGSRGPIALQEFAGAPVRFRNLQIRPLP